MSLLMEALRKAEEAKRRMQQEELTAAGTGPRESVETSSVSRSLKGSGAAFTLEEREAELTPQYIRDNFTNTQDEPDAGHQSDVPSHVDAPESEPARQSAPEPARTSSVARRQQRAAAASVFAAKQHPASNRKTLTILVIVMVLMIPIGGGVLWYLQSTPASSIGINPTLASYDLSSRGLVGETPAPAVTANAVPTAIEPGAAATPALPDAAAEQPVVASAPAATEPVIETNVTTRRDVQAAPPFAAEPDIAANTTPAPPVAIPGTAGTNAGAEPAQPVTPSTSVLEISRSRGRSQVNPDLVVAYESLQSGDLPTARRLYQQLLGVQPNNRDAMLGLASINLRQGEPVLARELYARLLQLNPRDPLAHTGLLQTMQVTDAAEHERALKSLMAQYPDVAQLTLALGNHYAAQQRWSEAQGAYYNALLAASRNTSGPVHPDYAFNLAVSLEQLNEPQAALDYYRRARELATEVTPGFDLQLLNNRLAYLSTQAQP